MKNFKYLLIMVAVLGVSLTSCSDDDDDLNHDFHYEYVSVTDAEVPAEFIQGNMYYLNVTIELPNSCYYYYNQYDYIYDGSSRLIYPIAHVDDGVECNQLIRETTFSIAVHVLQSQPYTFKFYQGEDAEGNDTFLTIEVPVN